MSNPIETWKAEKHPFEVWTDLERHAAAKTPMSEIDTPDLERMKWHGFFYRKRDKPGRYMNRVRITGCELTSEQAREIAMMAYEYGHGIIDVTTRANLQIQGLGIEHLPAVAKRLEAVGLTSKQTGHDNIRNVFGHPYSGLLPDELIDTRDLCRQIDAVYLDNRDYSDLPRKINICLNGIDQHASHLWTQDLSFLATRAEDDEVLFQVLIAGTQGQNPRLAEHLPILLEPHQLAPVTQAVLDLFRAKGSREKRNRARLRFLLEEIGVVGALDWLTERLPFPLRPSVAVPSPTTSHDELVGWFRQTDPKRWTMGLSSPLGRMTWQQLEGLALLANRWADGQLRTTHEQGIAVVNIPTGFKDAAATDAAALGLSVHADAYELNTMACTGSQFCNIAVTETKGHMFQLIEKLRKKTLQLHGIRIHMSGCPSSCAQHFTADIGLKGVRVRRLIGTREGFDVYLGGGIAGQVHLGLLYKLGVDVDQLPTLIEEVTREFYLRHRPGQTFSAYWRERLKQADAEKVKDDDYTVPTWLCEACEYEHKGEDPPVFCPSCAGLRRNFARLEDGMESPSRDPKSAHDSPPPVRDDGFVFAAKDADLSDSEGLTVEVAGREYALFRIDGTVRAIDSECPHEGASLAEGEVKDGVVTCPWHSWTFKVCDGCSLDPPGNNIGSYETLVDGGNIFLRPPDAAKSNGKPAPKKRPKPIEAELTVRDVIQETPDVKTFRLETGGHEFPFEHPGQFTKVCVPIDGEDVWRSFTISSFPTEKAFFDLTIKRNPPGQVSNYLFDHVAAGGVIKVKAAQGGFYFDPKTQPEPLVLIAAGSGITPMMSILRDIQATNIARECTLLYGSRTLADVIFHEELSWLAGADWFQWHVSLTQPHDDWTGWTGRLDFERLQESVSDLPSRRYFLCGPNEFMDSFRDTLSTAGVAPDRIHTESFQRTGVSVMS